MVFYPPISIFFVVFVFFVVRLSIQPNGFIVISPLQKTEFFRSYKGDLLQQPVKYVHYLPLIAQKLGF